jgi:hypothetical protein
MLQVVDIFLNIKKIEKFQLFPIYLSPKNVKKVQKMFFKNGRFFSYKINREPVIMHELGRFT